MKSLAEALRIVEDRGNAPDVTKITVEIECKSRIDTNGLDHPSELANFLYGIDDGQLSGSVRIISIKRNY